MSAPHTPGTWRAESWASPPACGATTVLVDDPTHFSGKHVVAECSREEDARLIAATKELLAALQAEDEWRRREKDGALDPEWDYEVMVGGQRRAAIAKATGSAQHTSGNYGPHNPPRLRLAGESLEQYRIAMGWDAPQHPPSPVASLREDAPPAEAVRST